MKLADLIRRIDELIGMGADVQATRYVEGVTYPVYYVNDAVMTGWRSACLSFIDRVYGRNHVHFEQFPAKEIDSFYSQYESALAVLKVIRGEIVGGWLFQLKALVAAELFSDFIGQAEHLLNQGYKDAAAVMLGSVLEEHIRQLCKARGVDTFDIKDEKEVPRKADRLNAELAKTGAYTALEAKQVTAWLAIRNSAAHGDYAAYSADQVNNLATGIPSFIVRTSL
jgi:hypothetical protein